MQLSNWLVVSKISELFLQAFSTEDLNDGYIFKGWELEPPARFQSVPLPRRGGSMAFSAGPSPSEVKRANRTTNQPTIDLPIFNQPAYNISTSKTQQKNPLNSETRKQRSTNDQAGSSTEKNMYLVELNLIQMYV